MADVPSITLSLPITLERLSDLLCCAFEGGSNYWYRIEEFHEPKVLAFRTSETSIFRHLDYPLNEGGSLIVSDAAAADDEPRTERLDLASIKRGLKIFAQKYPRHFGDFLRENDDATTGDVFLQCCLFGEAVYG